MKVRKCFSFILVFLLMQLCATLAVSQTAAQPASGSLHGQVSDPSGAAIPNASLILIPAGTSPTPIKTQANGQGQYEFKGLPAGQYTLNVIADGFSVYENDNVVITTNQALLLNVVMAIEVEQQKIQVSDTAPTIDVNPANNAGAITLSGKELEALPDDPDELLTDLQALAGPSAGPNGGQLYIDGFTAGQLPPKSSIREIRINQNPFSSEYDKIGYGRIEIFTKPGTDNWHGDAELQGNDSALNTGNPFLGTAEEPGYYSTMVFGNIGGPLSKKASFFFGGQRRDINDVSVVDATTLDSDFDVVPFSQAVPNNRTRTNLGPRLDYQVSKNNTLTVRYQYWRDNEQDNGVGGFTLPSQSFNSLETEHTLQASDTQIFGANIVNEMQFQYERDISSDTPQSMLPTINVQGYFNG